MYDKILSDQTNSNNTKNNKKDLLEGWDGTQRPESSTLFIHLGNVMMSVFTTHVWDTKLYLLGLRKGRTEEKHLYLVQLCAYLIQTSNQK